MILELDSFEMIDNPYGLERQQCVLDFGDYELSIISGDCAYGTKNAPFEIAVFKNGDMVEMPGITDPNDTVTRFRTVEDVQCIMKKMFSITGKMPENESQ